MGIHASKSHTVETPHPWEIRPIQQPWKGRGSQMRELTSLYCPEPRKRALVGNTTSRLKITTNRLEIHGVRLTYVEAKRGKRHVEKDTKRCRITITCARTNHQRSKLYEHHAHRCPYGASPGDGIELAVRALCMCTVPLRDVPTATATATATATRPHAHAPRTAPHGPARPRTAPHAPSAHTPSCGEEQWCWSTTTAGSRPFAA